MAWATPKTWKVGETPGGISAHDILNQDLRDSMLFLYSPPRGSAHRTGGGDNAANKTETNAPINTEIEMVDFTLVSNTLLQVPLEGYYLCWGLLTWEAIPANCTSRASIRGSNGAEFDYLVTAAAQHLSSNSQEIGHELCAPTYMPQGARIYLSGWQDSGTTRAMIQGSTSSWRRVLGAFWIGGL